MSNSVFQEAYRRVRARFNEEEWLGLHPRQITDAIYREIKVMDAERVGTSSAETV